MIHVEGCRVEFPDHAPPCRDGRGSPRIILPELVKGKQVVRSYSRASSYGDALDDKGNLIAWSQANAIRGVIAQPGLQQRFAELDDGWVDQDKKAQIKRVIEDAARAGGSEVKANKGSDVHRWTELLDLGLLHDRSDVPEEFRADLMAYEWATEDVEHLLIERFTVLDSHKVAGTPDRVSRIPGKECPECGLDTYIWDLKTGRVSFPQKMAVQLAIYSRAQLYTQLEDGTALREPQPDVCQHRGVILNLPAGSAQVDLFWIDLEKGWLAIENMIPVVKLWRSDKSFLTPLSA